MLEESRDAENVRVEAAALTLLGELYAANGDYDDAEATLSEAVQKWREAGDGSGVANALRELGMSHLFRGEHNEADALISEALAAYRNEGNRRGEAWALQNVAWISFSRGDAGTAEHRLQESAELFGELGDWGGLGWAFGLLAFVRYMQGRLDEAAELAEQIAVEGLASGNTWAVGMMDVLLADIALWRGRSEDAVREGRAAVQRFQEIGDRWGETQASAPVIRALAELGQREASQACLARLREIVQFLPSEGMQRVPDIVQSNVLLQYGDPEAAAVLLGDPNLGDMEIGSTDLSAAYGLMLLQMGRAEEAIAVFEPAYVAAEFDGVAMNMGSRLALAFAVQRQPDDALRVVRELQDRAGGTYHDRLVALWAEAAARHQTGARSPRRGRRRPHDRDHDRRAARARDRRARARARARSDRCARRAKRSAPTRTVSSTRSTSPGRAGPRSSGSPCSRGRGRERETEQQHAEPGRGQRHGVGAGRRQFIGDGDVDRVVGQDRALGLLAREAEGRHLGRAGITRRENGEPRGPRATRVGRRRFAGERHAAAHQRDLHHRRAGDAGRKCARRARREDERLAPAHTGLVDRERVTRGVRDPGRRHHQPEPEDRSDPELPAFPRFAIGCPLVVR